MSPLLIYLLKLSLSLTVMYAFYRIVLQRFTFYRHNRWYLLLYSMVSFLIPLIDLATLWSPSSPRLQKVSDWVPPVVTQYTGPATRSAHGIGWLMWLFAAVSMFLLVRMLIRLWSLQRLRKKASLLREGQVKVYQVEDAIAPFSFGNAIYINQHQHTAAELENILRHEFVHVSERHTIDMLWAEFLCLVNWYNPAAWLIRKAIRQNLEFIADNRVLETGVNKKEYQYLLLQVLGQRPVPAGISFNVSSLKKRIAMMNKNKTARAHLSWFFLLLPVAAIVLLSFRSNWPPPEKMSSVRVTPGPILAVADTVPRVEEVRIEKKAPVKSNATVKKKAEVEPKVEVVPFDSKKEKAETKAIHAVPAAKSRKDEPVVLELKPAKEKEKSPEKLKLKEPKVEKVKLKEPKVEKVKFKETAPSKKSSSALPTEKQWKLAEKAAKEERKIKAPDHKVSVNADNRVVYRHGDVTMVSDTVRIILEEDSRNETVEISSPGTSFTKAGQKVKEELVAPRGKMK